MIKQTIIKWADFKALMASRDLNRQCVEITDRYYLYGLTKDFQFEMVLKKKNPDATDFVDNFLSTFNKKEVEAEGSPFSSSETKDGTLIRRDHGVISLTTPAGVSEIELVIPYDVCKISEIEIIGAEIGDTANFKVFSGETLVNQFGFDTGIGKDAWSGKSNYAATLLKDMRLLVEFNNRGTAGKKVVVNFNLHEVV